MTTQFIAVYEGGLLRPTVPIVLPEGTQVEITLKPAQQPKAPAARPTQSPAEILAEIAQGATCNPHYLLREPCMEPELAVTVACQLKTRFVTCVWTVGSVVFFA